ncbi:tldc domain-containing protein [Stylonychia lemnae]|uniref:Tldc domain-containing protein n=1 Tax=Stylonychia lemnae TaxID=5949 RepID=A0A078AGD3_STYLE|nr:tldc domain-containing protein [Stylonychia lemnae]|eukprot:CDW81360.1 tldc domain-containing protein [Stylonychia lemnae]
MSMKAINTYICKGCNLFYNLDNLDKLNTINIICDNHPEKMIKTYCKTNKQLLCKICSANCSCSNQGEMNHQSIFRKTLEDYIQLIIPSLQNELEMIQVLLKNLQQYQDKIFGATQFIKMMTQMRKYLSSEQSLEMNKLFNFENNQIQFQHSELQKHETIQILNSKQNQEDIKIIELEKQVADLQNQLKEAQDQLLIQAKTYQDKFDSISKRNKDKFDTLTLDYKTNLDSLSNDNQVKLDAQSKQHQAMLNIQLQENQAKLNDQQVEFQLQLENTQKESHEKLALLTKENEMKLESMQKQIQALLYSQTQETQKLKNHAKQLEEQPQPSALGSLVDNILNRNNLSRLFQLTGPTILLYRATRDGFKAQDFHSSCDNKGPTISFIKSQHNQIFGGYTSLSWMSPNSVAFHKDNDSFLFNLTKNTMHKQYQKIDYGIKHDKNYLMAFGYGDIMISYDCDINSQSVCDLGGTYMPPKDATYLQLSARNHLSGSYNYKVTEIEVYQVLV